MIRILKQMKGFLIGALAGAAFMWSMGENFNERSFKTGMAILFVLFVGVVGLGVQKIDQARRALIRIIDDKQ